MGNKAWKAFSGSHESAFNQIPGVDDDCIFYDGYGMVRSGNLAGCKIWNYEGKFCFKLFNLNMWGVKKNKNKY